MIRGLVLALWAGSAMADPVDQVQAAAQRHFADMPNVVEVSQIAGTCGASGLVNHFAAYCTSQNTIYVTRRALTRPQAPYFVAHLYGHAVQVQHGVADVALATIRANPTDEIALRRDVTRMVDCIAGVLMARASLPAADLIDWFPAEPFTGSHWGRNPLRVGPQVRLGLSERAAWFAKGQTAATPEVCATDAFPADLLVAAFQDR